MLVLVFCLRRRSSSGSLPIFTQHKGPNADTPDASPAFKPAGSLLGDLGFGKRKGEEYLMASGSSGGKVRAYSREALACNMGRSQSGEIAIWGGCDTPEYLYQGALFPCTHWACGEPIP